MTSRERFQLDKVRLLKGSPALDPLSNALLAIGFLFTEIDRLQKRIVELEGDQK